LKILIKVTGYQPVEKAPHLLGEPMRMDWLQDISRNGRQRQHAEAALELAM